MVVKRTAGGATLQYTIARPHHMPAPGDNHQRSGRAIGQRVALLREIAGLTQGQLARQIGVSQGTVSAFEKGSRPPGLKAGHRICDVFGCTLDYIYRGDTSGLPMRLLTEINLRRLSPQC